MAKQKKPTASAAPRRKRGELPEEFATRKLRARMELRVLRHADRQMRAELSNYQAADRGRRNKDWRSPPGSADLMILPETAVLNARARQTVRDSWIGASIVRAAKRNIAGTGIDVVPVSKDIDGNLLAKLNARARALFWRWASDKLACDVERRQNFWQKQRLAVSERYAVGQYFSVWSYEAPARDSNGKVDRRRPVGLRLQSFEAEQLDTWTQSYTEGETVREVRNGIELDHVTGAAVAYHFFTRNPQDYLARNRYKSVRIEASRVWHYFDQDRVLQSQGVTQLAPILQEVRDFNRFKDATLWRAIMESCIGAIVKQSPMTPSGLGSPLNVGRAPGDTGQTPTGMNTTDFVPGMVPHLAPGEDVVPYTPTTPGNQYDPFTAVTLRGIGAGVGMSYTQLSRHSDGNYSAARQDMLGDWDEFQIEQDNLSSDLILPAYVLFFNLAVLEGRFDDEEQFDDGEFLADPDRFTDAVCVAPAKPWIDPKNEADAFAKMIDYRIITREEINAGRGKRFAEQIRKMGEERLEAEGEGIVFPEDVDQRGKAATAEKDVNEGQAKLIAAKATAATPPTDPKTQKTEFLQKVAMAFLQDGTTNDVIYNLTRVEDLMDQVGIPREPKLVAPFLPVIAQAGPLVTGGETKDPEGDIVGGAVAEVGGATPLRPPGNTSDQPDAGNADAIGQQAKAMAELAKAVAQLTPKPITKLLQLAAGSDVAPGYRASTEAAMSCADCKFLVAGRCTAYDFVPDLTYVCETFETPAVTDGTSARSVQAPGIADGSVTVDDSRNAFSPQTGTLAAKAPTYDFSSVQIDIPEPVRSQILVLGQRLIPDDLLAGDGREANPHITALWGVKNPAPGPVKAIAADVAPFDIVLDKTGFFPGEEHDVVWVGVRDGDVIRLHNLLSKLPNVQTFDAYRPHLTLAYVAKGQGARFGGWSDMTFLTFRVERLTFSSASGQQYEIRLTGKSAGAARLSQSAGDLPAATSDVANKTVLMQVADGESCGAFVARFMADDGMIAAYPDESMRRTEAETCWEKRA